MTVTRILLHDPSASQLSRPIFIILALKNLIRGIKLAKSLRKKVSWKEKLKFERSRYFDFISSNAALTRVVKSLCAGMKPRTLVFRSGSVSCYEFYSEKDVYYFEDSENLEKSY